MKRQGKKAMKRILFPLLAGAIAVIAAGVPAIAQPKKELVLLTNASADFWTIARRGIEKAQKELPQYKMDMVLPSDFSAAGQRAVLDTLVARGVAGISISVVDATHSTETLNNVATKTILFTTDSDAPQSKRLAYIGTDNFAAGEQAGAEIKKALPNGGKIMLFVGSLDSDNARERVNGIKKALMGTKIEVIDVRTDETDQAKARRNVEDTLTKYPNIDLLCGLYSYNTPQIYNAVMDAGRAGKVKIVGFDEGQLTLKGIAEGVIISTVVQQPFEFGYQSMIDLDKVLRGDKSFIPQDGKIIVPTRVIDKTNVAEFVNTMKQLLAK
jgi:ribose transport system substrate-binding protein